MTQVCSVSLAHIYTRSNVHDEIPSTDAKSSSILSVVLLVALSDLEHTQIYGWSPFFSFYERHWLESFHLLQLIFQYDHCEHATTL